MPMAPTSRPAIPLVPLLLGGLVAIALVGAVLGGLGDGPATSEATPTATPSLLAAGGSAWPAPPSATATATPTLTPTVPPTATPPATPTPSIPNAASFAIRVCRDQRAGRCVGELDPVRGDFVVVVSFTDSSRGDQLAIHLQGPDGGRLDGATLTLGGGRGAAWSNFHGGLASGPWAAVARLNGVEVARTTFVAR